MAQADEDPSTPQPLAACAFAAPLAAEPDLPALLSLGACLAAVLLLGLAGG